MARKTALQKASAKREAALSLFTKATQDLNAAYAALDDEGEAIEAQLDALNSELVAVVDEQSRIARVLNRLDDFLA